MIKEFSSYYFLNGWQTKDCIFEKLELHHIVFYSDKKFIRTLVDWSLEITFIERIDFSLLLQLLRKAD